MYAVDGRIRMNKACRKMVVCTMRSLPSTVVTYVWQDRNNPLMHVHTSCNFKLSVSRYCGTSGAGIFSSAEPIFMQHSSFVTQAKPAEH